MASGMHGRWLLFCGGFERHLEAKVVGFALVAPTPFEKRFDWVPRSARRSLLYDADYNRDCLPCNWPTSTWIRRGQ